MKVVISGSFRKSLTEIIELKEQLEGKGIEVLNPKSKATIDNNAPIPWVIELVISSPKVYFGIFKSFISSPYI